MNMRFIPNRTQAEVKGRLAHKAKLGSRLECTNAGGAKLPGEFEKQ